MTRRIVEFIHGLCNDDLPDAVVRRARCCLLDALGAGLAGRATDLSQIIHDHAAENFSGQGALLWQDGREVSPLGAALANGMTIDSLDIHDGHSLTKGHAGAAIVPAALALLRVARGLVHGRELLTSLALGYEIALRAGIALHGTASDYHSSGAWNALGCAAMGARRLALTPEQTWHALGIAEYHAPRSQIMRCVDCPTMLKDGSGWGAMAGVSAALLARNNFTGRPAVLVEEDKMSLYWHDLGSRWVILDQYFKPHAVCRWAQPAIEGALQLSREQKLNADSVESITIETFHEATRLTARRPATTEEAQYSLPFAVAAAVVHGELGPLQLVGSALLDPRVLRLSHRVVVNESAEFSRAFPARRLANVTLHVADGRSFRIEQAQPRWEGGDEIGDAEVIEKFRRLTASLPAAVARRTEQLVLELHDSEDASGLAAELAAAPRPKS